MEILQFTVGRLDKLSLVAISNFSLDNVELSTVLFWHVLHLLHGPLFLQFLLFLLLLLGLELTTHSQDLSSDIMRRLFEYFSAGNLP